MTIVEFLEARLAEDEADAQEVAVISLASFPFGVEKPYAARASREVEAKRAIIATLSAGMPEGDVIDGFEHEGWEAATEQVLLALALVYKDHPDFDGALYG